MNAFILTVMAAVLAAVILHEAKAWLPWVHSRLLLIAVSMLPKEMRARYAEEWRSFLDEMPGDFGRILSNIGFLNFAATVNIAKSFSLWASIAGLIYHLIIYIKIQLDFRDKVLPVVREFRGYGFEPPETFLESPKLEVAKISLRSAFDPATRTLMTDDFERYYAWVADVRDVISDELGSSINPDAPADFNKLSRHLRVRRLSARPL